MSNEKEKEAKVILSARIDRQIALFMPKNVSWKWPRMDQIGQAGTIAVHFFDKSIKTSERGFQDPFKLRPLIGTKNTRIKTLKQGVFKNIGVA